MSFISEIKKCFTEKELPIVPPFRALLLGDRAVYFESIKSIVSYEEKEIILSTTGGGIKVTGNGLYIKKYCSGDVVICGKITVIERI